MPLPFIAASEGNRPRAAWRLAVFVACAALGCSRSSSPGDVYSDVDARVAKLETLHDPKALQEARQGIYALGPTAIAPLQTLIISYYDHSQTQLIAVLSCYPDARTVPLLTTLLHNRYPDRRRQALYGISLMPRPPQQGGIIPLTKSRFASDREWALYALDETRDTTARAAFFDLSKDSDAGVRMQAARGLRHFPGPDSEQVLGQMMDDKASGVAMEATISLGRLDPSNAKVKARLSRFEPDLQNGSTDLKEEIAQILGESQTPTGEAMLAELLRDPDPRVRAVAASAYVRLGRVRDSGPLLEALKSDPDSHVRPRVAHAIAVLHVTDAVPLFRQMVFGKNRDAARAAAGALKDMCDPVALGTIQGMLKVPDYEIRRLSAVAQMRMSVGKPDYFPVIDQILADTSAPSAEARRTAATYLSDIPGPQAAARLDVLVSDSDPSVRMAAMEGRKKQMGMSRVLPDILEHPQPSWVDPVR